MCLVHLSNLGWKVHQSKCLPGVISGNFSKWYVIVMFMNQLESGGGVFIWLLGKNAINFLHAQFHHKISVEHFPVNFI